MHKTCIVVMVSMTTVNCRLPVCRDERCYQGRRWRTCITMLALFITTRKNYTIEAFTLLYQHDYSLPPKLAEELIWSRFVNTRGMQGRNIPLDLHQEPCKTCLGANKRGEGIVRSSKIVGTMDAVLSTFDEDNCVSDVSGVHKQPSYQKDIQIVT